VTNGEAWRYAVARCGDVVALLVVAIVSLTVAFVAAEDPAVAWPCWAAAVALMVLARRALRRLEAEL
jgi:uncharacterized protein (DUF983 family)